MRLWHGSIHATIYKSGIKTGKKRKGAVSLREIRKNVPYALFLAPAIIIYTIITFIPVVWTFFYSFTNFNGLSEYEFVGLNNYIQAFTTKNVVQSFRNTLLYAVAVPVSVTVLAIPLAVILSGKMKSRNLQRAIFFFPSVISSLFIGYIWNFILSASKYGLVNSILTGLGMEKLLLLSDPDSAMLLLILVTVWCNLGWHASIYIANIQTISPEFYEAAEVDGASAFDKFRYITFPMLAPAMTTSVMLLLTGSLKAFDMPFALTNGGPGYATTMITQTIITEGIGANRVGFASAMAFIFLFTIAVVSTIQTKFMTKREDNLR